MEISGSISIDGDGEIMCVRLQWLGHLERMPAHGAVKRVFIGRTSDRRPMKEQSRARRLVLEVKSPFELLSQRSK